jgi:hypothetical protein
MATKAKVTAKGKVGPGGSSRRGRSAKGRTTEKRPIRNVRYTPPIPKKVKSSPPWMAALLVGLFLLGVVIIILNYAGLLPGGVDNWWLVAAIGSIFAGLMVATHYH